MRLKLRLNPRLRPKARHRLTIVCGRTEIPSGTSEVYRVDIPVEVSRDEFGEYLVIPDNAYRNFLGETKEIDYVEVRLRSVGAAVIDG